MVTFGFTMKSGTTIYRNYIVDSQIFKDILQAAYREGDYKKDRYSILNIDSKYLFSITGIFGDGVYTTLWERDKEKIVSGGIAAGHPGGRCRNSDRTALRKTLSELWTDSPGQTLEHGAGWKRMFKRCRRHG